jgi:ERF superfamily
MSDEVKAAIFEHSETIGKLVGALAKARKAFSPALKDRSNSAYSGAKYVPLENLIDATSDALSDNELAVLQLPVSADADRNIALTTILAHSSGEWISSRIELPATMRERYDAQTVGSGITYARRYSYQSMLNIAGEVDDDGNAAAGVGSKQAADAVAKRKVEAHAKANGATPVLEFTPAPAGMTYLHGNEAMALLRVNVSEEDKALVIWLPNSKKNAIPSDQVEKFFGLCQLHGIEPKIVAAAQGAVSTPVEAAPTIRSVSDATTKKHQPYLIVRYGTEALSTSLNCFDKDLFEYLKTGIGKPASLVVEKKGDYSNIKGIEKIGSQTFSVNQDGKCLPDIQTKPIITDDDLPKEMFE